MDNLLNMISVSGIVETTIGAFLGFFFALLTEKLIGDANKKKTIDNVIDELVAYRNDLGALINPSIKIDLEDKNFFSKPYSITTTDNEGRTITKQSCLSDLPHQLVYSFYVPIWDTILETGVILEFKDKPYFNDLILVYSNINKLNRLTECYCTSNEKNNNERTIMLMNIIVQARYVHKLLTTDALPAFAKLLK